MKVEDIKVGMKVKIARITTDTYGMTGKQLHLGEVGTVGEIVVDAEWGHSIEVNFEYPFDIFAYPPEELDPA